MCTIEEQTSIEQYREFQQLKEIKESGLTPDQQIRYEELNEKAKRKELKSFVSYIEPVWFYLIYAIVVGIYTMLGGFRAAAITDAIQGLLIIFFSAILIPVGLAKVGGFSGLHASVPDYMFQLFGSASMSEYAWYTILAMVLANLVSIVAVASGMQTAGSATNEATARFGMIVGMFSKRIIMIFWALAGLLAIAIYAGQLHDPDLIWGYMTSNLLFPGAIGLMLVGILAANMSTLDASSVSYAALFIRNLLKPFVPNKSEQYYLRVGRIAIAVTLLGGVGVALVIDNLLELFKYIISIPAIFGASIWLGFVWRRLSRWAVIIQVAVCMVIYVLIPNTFPSIDIISTSPTFLKETAPKEIVIMTGALEEDVEKGLADSIGQPIEKRHVKEPVGIFFDVVTLSDPADPTSPKVGQGRFHAELWVLSWFGIDFTHFTKPQLVATRFFFDALFPFLLLFLLSFVTKPVSSDRLDRFFAKMHTPVQKTDEEEERALTAAYANPRMYDKDKLFRSSQWEILKPGRMDYIGFFGSWVLVGLVIFLLWLVVTVR